MGFLSDIGKWIAIALVVVAFIYLAVALMVSTSLITVATATSWLGFGVLVFSSAWSLVVVAGVALTLAYLIDPAAAQEAVDRILGAVGDVVEDLAGGVSDLAASVTKGFFSSPFGIAVLAFGGYLLYSSISSKQEKTQ